MHRRWRTNQRSGYSAGPCCLVRWVRWLAGRAHLELRGDVIVPSPAGTVGAAPPLRLARRVGARFDCVVRSAPSAAQQADEPDEARRRRRASFMRLRNAGGVAESAVVGRASQVIGRSLAGQRPETIGCSLERIEHAQSGWLIRYFGLGCSVARFGWLNELRCRSASPFQVSDSCRRACSYGVAPRAPRLSRAGPQACGR